MKKVFAGTALFTLLLCLAMAQGSAQSIDVTGKWNMKVELNVGSGTPVFVLKQAGATITGTYTGQLGESAVIGTIKGTEIRLEFKAGEYNVVYTGTVAGNTIIGKVAISDLAEGTFSGTREIGK